MTPPQLGHVTIVYGFLYTAMSLITAKFGKTVNQHLLVLLCRYSELTIFVPRD